MKGLGCLPVLPSRERRAIGVGWTVLPSRRAASSGTININNPKRPQGDGPRSTRLRPPLVSPLPRRCESGRPRPLRAARRHERLGAHPRGAPRREHQGRGPPARVPRPRGARRVVRAAAPPPAPYRARAPPRRAAPGARRIGAAARDPPARRAQVQVPAPPVGPLRVLQGRLLRQGRRRARRRGAGRGQGRQPPELRLEEQAPRGRARRRRRRRAARLPPGPARVHHGRHAALPARRRVAPRPRSAPPAKNRNRRLFL